MVHGTITLNGKGTVKALLSNGKEEVIKTNITAEEVNYRTWWEDPTGEGMGEVQFEEWDDPKVDEVNPTYADEFEYVDGRERDIADETEIFCILEFIDVEWEADMDTYCEYDYEPDYDLAWKESREDWRAA